MSKADLKCRSLVVKVASRCNLNCTYCYMYNMGDNSYKGQPKVMPDEVVEALLHKTLNHCRAHGISEFLFGFHGGEPLLAGQRFFLNFVNRAQRILLPEVTPYFSIQTNGTLLSEDWCRLFGKLQVHVGISLDGMKEENDRFRIDHAGRGSYERIIGGLQVAMVPGQLVAPPALLSVINIAADPVATYLHFKHLGVRTVDFLLPDSTHDQPPVSVDEEKYADWLIKIFDLWITEDNQQRLGINLFEGIINSLLGHDMGSEILGAGNNELLVVETDGSIEAVDVLKICGDGFTKKQLNVQQHSLDEALQNELAALYNSSHQQLCRQCSKCPISDIRGGGYLPHRYSSKNGFDNPSVYCGDLLKLITHIQNKVLQQLPASLLEVCDVTLLDYEEAKKMIGRPTGILSDTSEICLQEKY